MVNEWDDDARHRRCSSPRFHRSRRAVPHAVRPPHPLPHTQIIQAGVFRRLRAGTTLVHRLFLPFFLISCPCPSSSTPPPPPPPSAPVFFSSSSAAFSLLLPQLPLLLLSPRHPFPVPLPPCFSSCIKANPRRRLPPAQSLFLRPNANASHHVLAPGTFGEAPSRGRVAFAPISRRRSQRALMSAPTDRPCRGTRAAYGSAAVASRAVYVRGVVVV